MDKNRKRNHPVLLRFSEEEMNHLHQKMIEAGVKNREAYLRKMSLDGYIVKQDYAAVKEAVHQLNKIGVNLNQIAKTANSYGDVYLTEIQSIKKEMEKIWQLLSSKV